MSKELVKVKGKGKIYFHASIDLAPFFKKNIENKFFDLRHREDFDKKLVGFGSVWSEIFKDRINKYCEIDNDTIREIEKTGYDIGIFRGIIYDDFFTPTYKIKPACMEEFINKHREQFNDKRNDIKEFLKNGKISEAKRHKKEDELMSVDNNISIINNIDNILDLKDLDGNKLENVTACQYWVGISKSGIARFVFAYYVGDDEMDIDINCYYEPTKIMLRNPYIELRKSLYKEIGIGNDITIILPINWT